MFTKGAIAATFCVNTTDDELYELDETFSLVIDAASLPASVIHGNPYTANVTILDNECTYIISAYLLRTPVHGNICCINNYVYVNTDLVVPQFPVYVPWHYS